MVVREADHEDGGRAVEVARHAGAVHRRSTELTMTSNTHARTRSRLLPVLGFSLAFVLPLGCLPLASADGGPDQGGVVGTYAVRVTLTNCATGAPLGPPFDSLVTLHAGGTISESAGSLAFAPGQRSPGHGSWVKVGRHTYQQEMVALILFNTAANLPGTPTFDPTKPVTPGFQAGWQTVSHTIVFSDATHATSSGGNAFYTLAGTQYRTGCSTAGLERLVGRESTPRHPRGCPGGVGRFSVPCGRAG